MKIYITFLFLLIGSVFPVFGQMPDFLGISINENLSTWKSRLSEKGFAIVPDRSTDEDSESIMSNTYFQGKFQGYDCIINLLHAIEGESVFSFVVNINCRTKDELNKAFETNLNDYLRRYSNYEVEYKEDDVHFEYDTDNNGTADMTIGLCKRLETLTVNDVEMSNVLQVVVFNVNEMAMQIVLNEYKKIEKPTVLGIDFGSDKYTVLSTLRERFGHSNVTEENGIIEVENPSLGGFKFQYASFEFQYERGKTYLSNAVFQTNYTLGQESLAKRERDYLLSLMQPKYEKSIENFTNEDGFKCHRFGTNPRDLSKSLGLIILKKGTGKDGIKRLYLILSYGPINYIDPSSDF